jgi:hypothetical protein
VIGRRTYGNGLSNAIIRSTIPFSAVVSYSSARSPLARRLVDEDQNGGELRMAFKLTKAGPAARPVFPSVMSRSSLGLLAAVLPSA